MKGAERGVTAVDLAKETHEATLLLCGGTGCLSSRAREVFTAINLVLAEKGLAGKIRVKLTGCHGFCEQGPVMAVKPKDYFYCRLEPEDVPGLIEALLSGKPYENKLYRLPGTDRAVGRKEDIPFYKKQQRLVLRNCGEIDPEDIDDYLIRGGYRALEKALGMTPEQVIAEIKASGLRGRGGAGFPTGNKWEIARNSPGSARYVICNADEGDPGAFMDRSICEGDPHAVLEGLIIAGYAIGARQGYIYIRAEYPLAVERLEKAVVKAGERGFLGRNILNSGFDFDVEIVKGAGAFVCGEETALIESIQGNRGMPRPRPPYPAVRGLWDCPTVINNVETLANVPLILNIGARRFAEIGTEQSKGTKIFALTGKVNNTGLVEVPMGTTLKEIIFAIGGGIKGGKKFKAVQIGGPSGGCLGEKHLHLPVDFDSLIAAGVMMGSGGLVVMDENTCMVELARFFLSFTRQESCGKCTPCREGTTHLLRLLEKITRGEGKKEDLERIEELSRNIIDSSLCGLGQSAPNPVLSTLRYFRDEYELHVEKKICPAGVCRNLLSYRIIAERCRACSICKKACPAGAIAGEKGKPHRIDPELCAKCGECLEKCPFEAIIRG
ncbi:MAG: hypothetical protein PWQ31_1589 [Eubacteriales bacterium]|nr:hypothetical protein [Eubacteriales bacterium]